jgi:amino acid adenylation domain-containing protein
MDSFDTSSSAGFLIPHYLEQHALHRPQSCALVCRGETMNYGELASRSRQLARCLLQNGVRRGDRVGIHMEKSLELGVSLHGIMRAGAAYVPLDPSAPPERVAQMIRDCDIRLLISAPGRRVKLQQLAKQLDTRLLVIGIEGPAEGFDTLSWPEISDVYDESVPEIKLLDADLAYIIYTSGSTGEPKGIMHSHYSSLSYSRWAALEYDLRSEDRVGNHAPLHFDISIFDFIAGVVAGACVVMIPEEYLKFPASYSQLIADNAVTVLFTVPFALIQLSTRGVLEERDLSSLRWVIFGGEPMPSKHLARLQQQIPSAAFDNMYGPAEINGVTHYTVPRDYPEEQGIPIGPISQVAEALVVDDELNRVDIGAPGELLVRSSSMMLGYWRRPDLNSAAIIDINDNSIEKRYYRTGDVVREDEDGTLWFLGRADRQVKVRGYRVELDEVEAVLIAHPQVEAAAAFILKNEEGGANEVGVACIPLSGEKISTGDLQRYLKGRLPAYEVPSHIMVVEELPRTSTGKIDRRALGGRSSL